MKKSTPKVFTRINGKTSTNIPKVRKQGFFKKLRKVNFFDLTTKKEELK